MGEILYYGGVNIMFKNIYLIVFLIIFHIQGQWVSSIANATMPSQGTPRTGITIGAQRETSTLSTPSSSAPTTSAPTTGWVSVKPSAPSRNLSTPTNPQIGIERKQVYNVLSLDGGGIRGIGTLVILAKLQEAGLNIHETFDMFIGTSTGGIIAIMLSEGWKPTEILDFYIDNGPVIFQQTFAKKLRSVFGLAGTKYSKDQLEMISADLLAQKKLTETKKPVGVTSYNATQKQQTIISSWDKEGVSKNFSVQDAVRATSAAPTYFKGKEVAGDIWIDGGVGANDPSTSAYLEAKKLFPSGAKIRVVSIGTGAVNESVMSRDSGIKDIKTIISTLMQASESANREMISKLTALDPNLEYIRIQFTLPKAIDLADTRKKAVETLMKAAFERTQKEDFRALKTQLLKEQLGSHAY